SPWLIQNSLRRSVCFHAAIRIVYLHYDDRVWQHENLTIVEGIRPPGACRVVELYRHETRQVSADCPAVGREGTATEPKARQRMWSAGEFGRVPTERRRGRGTGYIEFAVYQQFDTRHTNIVTRGDIDLRASCDRCSTGGGGDLHDGRGQVGGCVLDRHADSCGSADVARGIIRARLQRV